LTVYANATMSSYFPDCVSETYQCEVRINDSTIVVSYRSEDGSATIYKGTETGAGHYKLTMEVNGQIKGRATLHRLSADDDLLEGSWYEDGDRGMWQIDLNADDD